jgi:lysozyme
VAKRTKKKKPTPKKRRPEKMYIQSVVALFIIVAAIAGYLYVRNKIREARIEVAKEKVIRTIPYGFSSFGIDISHHQGKIDWEKLMKSEHYDTVIHFVYCKATEGTDFLDTKWYQNRKELRRLKIPHGAYHYFRNSDPILQAEHFLRHWIKKDGDLPPVLDVEYECFDNPDLHKNMDIWLNIVEYETGMRPVIYTSLHMYETKFPEHFKDYKFWIAAYSRQPDCLDDERIIHWQFTDRGELPRMKRRVDMNVSKILIQ